MEPERPELIEGKAPVEVIGAHEVDAIELLVTLWVVRLLPGLRVLEGEAIFPEQHPQLLAPNGHTPGWIVTKVGDEFSDAPAGEGQSDRFGSGVGRLDDEGLILSRYPAGTA